MGQIRDLRRARAERELLSYVAGQADGRSVLGIACDGDKWVVVRAPLGSSEYVIGKGADFYEAWEAAAAQDAVPHRHSS